MITLDQNEVPHHELVLGDHWDAFLIRDLVEVKSRVGDRPAYLLLGRHETELLRTHLAKSFGQESVSTLRDTYYLGMEVIVLHQCDSYFAMVGHKGFNRILLHASTENGGASSAA